LASATDGLAAFQKETQTIPIVFVSELFLRSITTGAATFSVKSVATPVQDVAEIEAAMMALARQPNAGLICPSDRATRIYERFHVKYGHSSRPRNRKEMTS
jgi:hypothetical protein